MTREESIALYKAHSKRLYNISLRIVRDSAVAEEIMQDTILKAIQKGPELSISAWLTKTCIRASIDVLRKRKRERLFLEEYAAEEAFDSPEPASILEIDKIRDAIRDIKDPYGLVLNLVLIEGLDYEEISGYTGEREGTIRTQYSRARKMLAEKLREMTP